MSLSGRGGADGERLLGDSLEAYLRLEGHAHALVLARVSALWADVVGAQVAAYVQPCALKDGTLVVAVDHASWSAQLRFVTEQVLSRLAEAIGPGLVTRIEATVQRT
jgi:predicted nucleic acid-binding Zn ribbon protein